MGRADLEASPGFLGRVPDVLDAGGHGGEGDEAEGGGGRGRERAGDGGLAGAGRPPE